ncbi:MAG: VanW family protein, partial [Clostridia bacterium]|nr:VanW family protein [Clostridia bacterium]
MENEEKLDEMQPEAPRERRRRMDRKKKAAQSVDEVASVPQTAEPQQQSNSEVNTRAQRNRRKEMEIKPAAPVTIPESEVPKQTGIRGYTPEKVTPQTESKRGGKAEAGQKTTTARQEARTSGSQAGQQSVQTTGPQPVQGNIRTTGPQPVQQNIRTTGPQPVQQNFRTTGPQPVQQNIRTTGPQPVQQNIRTTGPQPVQQNIRTTGPQPVQQGIRTTGPQPVQQNIRTTGPQPVQQNIRTTGPQSVQQNIRTTGPQPVQQNIRTTGPQPVQQNIRTTGPQPVQGNIRTTGPQSVPQGYGMRTTGPQSGVPMGAEGTQQGYNVRGTGAQQAQSGHSGPESMPQGYPVPQQGQYGHGNGMPDGGYPGQNTGGTPYYGVPYGQPQEKSVPEEPAEVRSEAKNPQLLRRILIGLLAAVLVVAGGILIFRRVQAAKALKALNAYVEPYNERYVPGVYVDGISLEGMSREQAAAMVESKAKERSNAFSVTLTYNGQEVRTITASELSMTVDVADVLEDAWNQGHIGTYEERRAAMQALLETPYEAYTANPSGDTSVIDSILSDLRTQVYRAPQDASIASFDPQLTYPFTFNEEVVGRDLNTQALRDEIYRRLSTMESGAVELTIETTEPRVTVAQIKESHVALRGTATTPISSSSAAERNENIRTAFAKISGTIIQPGGQFSFNGIVGPRTEKNGFLPAIEYAYGELSDGIGGGVCQASTTVYLAAVRAGMEILKREPHSDAVSYIEYGKDATVYWYSNHKIDMVFKNTTDAPVYVTASVQSSPTKRTNLVCVVNVYGAGMDGISYDIVTQETEIEAPTAQEYVKDKKG